METDRGHILMTDYIGTMDRELVEESVKKKERETADGSLYIGSAREICTCRIV